MAGLPSFLQAMFTPTGPPRQRVDQGGGEYTGSIGGVYEGDDSSPVFPRSITSRSVSGPTTRRLPDPLPGTGGGPSPLAQIGRDMKHLAGSGGDDGVDMTSITETALEPGGMSSISEIMQGQAGEMSPMGYQPFDPMGSGTDRMLGDSRFGGGAQPSYSMRDEFAEEGPGMLSQGPIMGTTPRHSNAHGFVGGGDSLGAMFTPGSFQHMDSGIQDDSGGASGGQDPRRPWRSGSDSNPIVEALMGAGNWAGDAISEIARKGTSGGTPVPTPGIQPGQTDPALGVPAPLDGHWPEWLSNLFARSTTGGAGRGPRVRR